MLEETKVLLRRAIAEAMAKSWDHAAGELLEILNADAPPKPQSWPKTVQVSPSMIQHGLRTSVPVKELPDRLGLSRSRIFALLSDLNLGRIIDDVGRTCVTGEDFLLLEQAITFFRNGGTIAEFRISHGLVPPPRSKIRNHVIPA